MAEAICDTSPLYFLHQAGVLHWLETLFGGIWVPRTVAAELEEGGRRRHRVPTLVELGWVQFKDPTSIPPEWAAFDLGAGELAAMALALESPGHLLLLDDGLARRVATSAGLAFWGTLRVLLEAKERGLTSSVRPVLEALVAGGMWISADLQREVLVLAGEEAG